MPRPNFQSIITNSPFISDSLKIKICQLSYADRVSSANFNTQFRVHYIRIIQESAENGFVALVHGGMDCDCVAYDGHVELVKATVKDVDQAIEKLYEYAEGPIHYSVKKPSEAKLIKSSSRDLGMEAYENGHSWSVHY